VKAGRKKNVIPTVKFEISTTEAVMADLTRLVSTGYFGKNMPEAAEQILRERLRSLIKEEGAIFKRS
jgi:hypothetical protein